MHPVIRELLPPETGLAFEAMRALRTDLEDEETFVQRVDGIQRAEGYRTRPKARKRGHGRALLTWLTEEAQRLRCDQLHLDSGVGLDRADAHRLYLNSGLVISTHHFARQLND